MRYLFGVLIPCGLQALLVLILVQTNTGNGSWVGLGAFLIGIIAIPATAIVNGLYIHSNKEKPPIPIILRCLGIAFVTPILIVLLSLIG